MRKGRSDAAIAAKTKQEPRFALQSMVSRLPTGRSRSGIATRSSSGEFGWRTAVAVISEVGHPALGICLDVFHFYVGPSKLTDLGYISRDQLFHVQLSDLVDTPREFATDSHRILPGDGDIPLAPILDYLREIDYSGYVSLEVMNPQLWQVSPRQFGEVGITALRKLLGQASMEGTGSSGG
jgi:2-keto-myo-inositol isomerase